MAERMAGLKDAFGGDFLVGAAVNGPIPAGFSAEEQGLFLGHFNSITTENCLKPMGVQAKEGVFTFEGGDMIAGFAKTHGVKMVGHTLVWHGSAPEWFFVDGEKAASRELVLRRLRTHIDAVVKRYRGTIYAWDVVNEVISDKAEEYLRPTKWLETVGEDYIVQVYRMAMEAESGTEWNYNDYNIEQPVKREKTLRLLRELKAAGVRVDAVGIQGHWLLDKIPYAEIEAAIEAFSGAGYKVMITELDVDELPFNEPEKCLKLPEAELKAAMERQAQQYGRLFELFRKHRDKVTRVTFWNLHDGRSWKNNWPAKGRTSHPLLFDRELRGKRGLEAVMRVGGRRG